MNRRALNSLLIVAVCSIWAVVIYRFVGRSSPEMVQAGQGAETITYHEPVKSVVDFTLNADYRDPFLDQSGVKITRPIIHEQASVSRQKIPNEVPAKTETKQFDLRFRGLVKNNNTSATIALISFDGKNIRLSLGQIYEGFRLEKAFRDSAILSRNKEKIIVRK